jgi:transposase
MVSLARTQEIISGALGVPVSTGTIQSMVYDCADKLSATVSAVKEALIQSHTVHFDETGLRVGGKLHWLHAASNDRYTYITVHTKRGLDGLEHNGVLPRFTGCAVHDCFSPYFKYISCVHALCNAHILRELKAVYEQTGQEWATDMITLLTDIKADVERCIFEGEDCLPSQDISIYDEVYDHILNSGFALNPLQEQIPGKKGKPKRSKARCLLDRLYKYRGMVLLFSRDFLVPFDNNQAERDIRITKVKQKVSGGLRSMNGAAAFATVTSYIQTARKCGVDIFNALQAAFLGKSYDVIF